MLFVYENIERKNELKKERSEYTFVGIAFFLQDSDNLIDILKLLKKSHLEKYIIDISNLVQDDNFFKLYIERLLFILKKYIKNVHFCIKETYLYKFLEYFPDFFDENEIDKTYLEVKKQNIDNQVFKTLSYNIPNEIVVYDRIQSIENYDKKRIISIGELLKEYNGLFLQYDIRDIKERLLKKKVDFIDVSSLMQIVKKRNDMVLQVEILLLKLSNVYENKYCIKNEFVPMLEEKLPYIFKLSNLLNEEEINKRQNLDNRDKLDIKQISKVIDEINSNLKGHEDFKIDLKNNLLKYAYLNSMRDRKVFSIIICGESGVGKTQFAKLLSEKMFPNEKLIKINFGNYSTEGVLNSLIGSPLGYSGSEEGGELINKIQNSKSKIILIDEFEKATPSVYNFFYELLEDGVFTDRHGEIHDLNGYIIVFTSNMSQEMYQKHIPSSLKSRFDMVYYFIDIPSSDKIIFIQETAKSLIDKLEHNYGIRINYEDVEKDLVRLANHKNLRDIKRKVEDIIFMEFFLYKKYINNIYNDYSTLGNHLFQLGCSSSMACLSNVSEKIVDKNIEL